MITISRKKSAGFTPDERKNFKEVLDSGMVDLYVSLYISLYLSLSLSLTIDELKEKTYILIYTSFLSVVILILKY